MLRGSRGRGLHIAGDAVACHGNLTCSPAAEKGEGVCDLENVTESCSQILVVSKTISTKRSRTKDF